MSSVHICYSSKPLKKAEVDISRIIDLRALQEMMDDLFQVTKIGFSLIDLNGNVLVGTGWQDICINFHRKNPHTLKNCLESDLELTQGVKEGEYRIYKCKNGLVDTVTPLFIGGKHVANIFSGQFFFKGEGDDNLEAFAAQAEKYGFDKEDYLCAFRNVPHWERGQVETLMIFYTKLTQMLSKKGLANLKLIQLLDEEAKTKEKLQISQEDLNRAQNVGKIGSWRVLVQGDLYWSDETYNIFGVSKGTPMTYERFTESIYPEDRQYVDREWQAALKGKPYDIEHRVIVNGKVVWVREKAELEFDGNGKLLGGFGTVQDITEPKKAKMVLEQRTKQLEVVQKKLQRNAVSLRVYASRMEELAEQRLQQLKEAERLAAIGATAGMVGHDIRNPLQAIVGDVYLLKDELSLMPQCSTKEAVTESLDSIEKNIFYIDKIVADLQDYARNLKPELTEINLNEFVRDVLKHINISDRISLSVEIDPCIIFTTDQTLLRRILTNLTINAIQAMERGGRLTINASREYNQVTLSVADTGVGIPENIKPKLFQPMTTSKSKGQGLGLAVVKRLAEALNGSISFESEEGKGTKFIINFSLN